jgi:O-antigen ligase
MPSILSKIQLWLWAAVWFSLPVSIRMNTLSLILFGLVTLVSVFYQKPIISNRQWIAIGLFMAFFLWNAASFLYDPDTNGVWKSLERKLSFFALPIILAIFTAGKNDFEKWAIRGFFAGLTFTGLHMLINASLHIIEGMGIGKWTYHAFIVPYKIGAIYYSWYLSIAILYLIFQKPKQSPDKLKYVFLLFFLVLLLLSASKLFIVLTVPILIWRFLKNWKFYHSKTKYLILGLTITILAFGTVPLSKRISELTKPDFEILHKNEFTYDTPFNGLTLRLLQWRFAIEILNDHHAWLTGIGIGSRQSVLDNYYIKHNVYHGNPDLGDTGYLGYNFHNQYVETLVGTGILGLILLLSIIIIIFTGARQSLMVPRIIYIFVLIFFITESVLERQVGIVLFCLLWATPITAKIKND